MSEDLRESIEWLVSRLKLPANNNCVFAGDVILSLMEAGHSLPDIETELRRQGSLLYLLGLPVGDLEEGLAAQIPSGEATSRLQAPFYLYCAMSGREEAERVIEAHGLTVAENLENLASTGIIFTDVDASESRVDTLETEGDFVRWLVLDAPDWLSRRAALREAERRGWLGLLAEQLDRLVQKSDDSIRTADQYGDASAFHAWQSDFLRPVRDTTRAADQYGSASAFRACEPIVLEAVHKLLTAPTWRRAGIVYEQLRDVLEGNLAIEILEAMATESKWTSSEIDVIQAHVKFLEVAFNSGVKAAIAAGDAALPAKYGVLERANFLVAYLSLPDLESARDFLHANPDVVTSSSNEIDDAIGRCRGDVNITLIGMLEESGNRGVDASYELWTRLEDAAMSEPKRHTIRWLEQLAKGDPSCLRDRALEVLAVAYDRLGRERDFRRAMTDLLVGRSKRMQPRRHAYDLINATLHEGARGNSEAVEGHLADIEDAVDMLREPAERADLWEKAAHCFADFLHDTMAALHHHRRALEDFRASGSLLAATRQLCRITWTYWHVARPQLMLTYAELAAKELQQSDDKPVSQTDRRDDVLLDVIETRAFAELAIGHTTEAADRLLDFLAQDMLQPGQDVERRVRALAVVAAVYDERVEAARELVSSWRDPDPATFVLASALVSLASSGVRLTLRRLEDTPAASYVIGDETDDRPKETDDHPSFDDAPVSCELDMAALRDALTPLIESRSALDELLKSGSARALADNVARALGAPIPVDPMEVFMPKALFGEYEAEVWKVARSRRGGLAIGLDRPTPRPLAPGSSWKAIIARYADLGVWEMPHLALYGPIVDAWGLASRFGRRVSIVRSPKPGWLTFLFFRQDSEGHLNEYRNGCYYIAENDIVLFSLTFLDELFGTQDPEFWKEERRSFYGKMAQSEFVDEANWIIFAIQASSRLLVEWIVAHEVGHAHHAHRIATSGDEAKAQETQADQFFIDGITSHGEIYLGVYLQAFFNNLNQLYRYSCKVQTGRQVSDDEIIARSVKIIDRFDMSGHRPLVIRAINLIRRILARYPHLDTTGYIEDFAAQIINGSDNGGDP